MKSLTDYLEEMPTGFHLYKGLGGWSIQYSSMTLAQYKNGLSAMKPPYNKDQFKTPLEAVLNCRLQINKYMSIDSNVWWREQAQGIMRDCGIVPTDCEMRFLLLIAESQRRERIDILNIIQEMKKSDNEVEWSVLNDVIGKIDKRNV